MITAPPLLTAARAKFLASEEFAQLADDALIGTWQQPAQPWVFVGTDPRNGLPEQYGLSKAAVTFYQRPRSWHTNDTSARFPVLAATVWAQGPADTSDAEWLAREVADRIVDCFDDFAAEHDPNWSGDVFVIRCRWSGELAVFEAEGVPGLYRAEVSFELETA